MKKKFKVENLDCAHCAAKMEEAIKKIPGVEDAVMNFMMQKLIHLKILFIQEVYMNL